MSEALEKIAEALAPPHSSRQYGRRNYNDKVHMLVAGWPSLAAALGELLKENNMAVPGPFRHAVQVMEQEREKAKRSE